MNHEVIQPENLKAIGFHGKNGHRPNSHETLFGWTILFFKYLAHGKFNNLKLWQTA